MNILTIIILGFLVLNSWIGMKRGLIKTVFSMFSMIVAIILTTLVSPVVSKSLQENEKIMGYFVEKAENLIPFEEIESKLELETKKTVQTEFLEKLHLPESVVASLEENNSINFYQAFGVDTFEDYLCHSIASVVINALAFALTFFVILILLKVLCFSLNLVSKLPVLNQANHLLGLAAGFLYAIMIVWVGCILLTAVSSTEAGSSLMKMVKESAVLSFIYNHNLLLSKVTDLTKALF